jgi:hypothetical protein
MKDITSKAVVFTFLALALAGCADPIVGRWEGKDDSTVDLDVQAADDGYRGDGHIYLCNDSDCFLCSFDFDAKDEGDGRLEIEGRFTGNCSEVGSFEGIECEVDGDEMECEIPNGPTIEYEKVN